MPLHTAYQLQFSWFDAARNEFANRSPATLPLPHFPLFPKIRFTFAANRQIPGFFAKHEQSIYF